MYKIITKDKQEYIGFLEGIDYTHEGINFRENKLERFPVIYRFDFKHIASIQKQIRDYNVEEIYKYVTKTYQDIDTIAICKEYILIKLSNGSKYSLKYDDYINLDILKKPKKLLS